MVEIRSHDSSAIIICIIASFQHKGKGKFVKRPWRRHANGQKKISKKVTIVKKIFKTKISKKKKIQNNLSKKITKKIPKKD